MIGLEETLSRNSVERGTLARTLGRIPGVLGLNLAGPGSTASSAAKLPDRRLVEKPPARRNLNTGSVGPDVRTLQARLNLRQRPSPELMQDGVYGRHTRDMVVKFQRSENLTPSGMVFARDWLTLFRRPGRPTHARGLKVIFIEQLGDFEVSLEERLGRLLNRLPVKDVKDRLAPSSGSGSNPGLAQLADIAFASAANTGAEPYKDTQLLGLEPRSLAQFRPVFEDFSEQFVCAVSARHLELATLLLGDVLQMVSIRQLVDFAKSHGGARSSKPEKKESEKPAARSSRQSSGPQRGASPSNPDTFDNVSQDEQAAALEAAARDGAPFCEECEKLRQQNKRKAAA